MANSYVEEIFEDNWVVLMYYHIIANMLAFFFFNQEVYYLFLNVKIEVYF